MWQSLYSLLVLPLLRLGVLFLSLFSRKVHRGLHGRRVSLELLRAFDRTHPSGKRLWIHASSMGEFEQAKPIIEAAKKEMPGVVVIASFFSPSGYENNLHYPYADHVTYIPFDTRSNARAFLDVLKPAVAAFIRYDIWPNHLWECRRRHIPMLLLNATLRSSSPRLWPLAKAFHRNLYSTLHHILAVSETDVRNFRSFNLSLPIEAIGDTRFDRVFGKALAAREARIVPDYITRGRTVVVAGSTWSEDEEVLVPVMKKLLARDRGLLFILVPHEPTLEHLDKLESRIGQAFRSIRFSHLARYRDESVVIVDSIGILLKLYAAADIAFVGGGFHNNVHNTLEPAAYGIPVVYGPRIENSQEAKELAEVGGGHVVRDRRGLYRALRGLIADLNESSSSGARAGAFVNERIGATGKIMKHLSTHLRD